MNQDLQRVDGLKPRWKQGKHTIPTRVAVPEATQENCRGVPHLSKERSESKFSDSSRHEQYRLTTTTLPLSRTGPLVLKAREVLNMCQTPSYEGRAQMEAILKSSVRNSFYGEGSGARFATF